MSTRSAARLLTAVVATLGLAAPAVAVAAAAPPPNDEPAGAVQLSLKPHAVEQDTSGATADATPVECSAGATVWYRMRVKQERTVRITTLGSDYDTLIAFFAGPPDSTTPVCKDDSVLTASAIKATLSPGTTYYLAVSACCLPRSRGGDLVLNVLSQTRFRASTKVQATHAGPVSGRAFVTGTQRCSHPAAFQVEATLSQRVGHWVARGKASAIMPFCHGPAAYALRIDSKTGVAFQPGRRAVLTFSSSAFDGFQTVTRPTVTRVVRLTVGRGAAQKVTGMSTRFRTLGPSKG